MTIPVYLNTDRRPMGTEKFIVVQAYILLEQENENLEKKRKLPLWRMPPLWVLLLTIPLALCGAAMVIYIQPGSFTSWLSKARSQPIVYLLNFLPIWLTVLGFSFLLYNPFFGTAAGGGLWGVLSLVNRTMIQIRDEPLSPKDLALIREAGNAAKDYTLNLHLPSIALILGMVLVMVAAGLLVRVKPVWEKKGWNLGLRLGAGAACFGVLWVSIFFLFGSTSLYASLKVNDKSYITGVYETLGFPYAFCYNFTTYVMEKPEGYSPQAAQALLAEQTTENQGQSAQPVHVVIVMNEAFSDLNNESMFDFPEGESPLENFNRLSQEKNAIVGHGVVPNYGGGTANSEFDVLTGMQTNLLGGTATSAFRVLHRSTDSLYRIFNDSGYETRFIHPGSPWFYNRQNVYKYFGADGILFEDGFAGGEKKGQWVTDQAVWQAMRQEFETVTASGQPYFNYTVTIQNHMSYTQKKYGEYVFPKVPLTVEVSPEAQSYLDVYTEGVRDADAMLGEMTTYFQQQKEPVVLLFFGDHRPNLGEDYLSYKALGMELAPGQNSASSFASFETPFLIWANDQAAQLLDFSQAKEALDLPENPLLSVNYLPGMLLELTGRGETDPFYQFLNQMRRQLPVVHKAGVLDSLGTYTSQVPSQYEKLVNDFKILSYYRIKDEVHP